ncbi:protein Daple-like [Myotis daubentonii]|uniref:protein Daple-like n=1 Tax=Myotis daubentonii TaxID=98922 RepID=UPI00287302BF|nr:protein Daple-like [Myotis daubentonii]
MELKEENQQLRKEMEELRLQLLQEKDNNREWETFTEELVKELEQLCREVDTLKADRALQMLELERQLQIEKDNSQKLENISKELLKDLNRVLDTVDTLQAKAPQMLLLEWQLQIEKDNSQNLENINKELLKDLKQVLDAVDTLQAKAPQLDPSLLASKNRQAAKERECEELYELLEQLIQVHEALRPDHASLGALHDQLSGQYQALVEEHSRHKTLLRRSLEMASKAFGRRWVPATVRVTGELSRLPSPFALAPRGSPGSAASQEEK